MTWGQQMPAGMRLGILLAELERMKPPGGAAADGVPDQREGSLLHDWKLANDVRSNPDPLMKDWQCSRFMDQRARIRRLYEERLADVKGELKRRNKDATWAAELIRKTVARWERKLPSFDSAIKSCQAGIGYLVRSRDIYDEIIQEAEKPSAAEIISILARIADVGYTIWGVRVLYKGGVALVRESAKALSQTAAKEATKKVVKTTGRTLAEDAGLIAGAETFGTFVDYTGSGIRRDIRAIRRALRAQREAVVEAIADERMRLRNLQTARRFLRKLIDAAKREAERLGRMASDKKTTDRSYPEAGRP